MTTGLKLTIFLASSRSNGNTSKLAQAVAAERQAKIIDLNKFSISYFDYEHENTSDDFLHLIEILTESDHVIFATPVYWYSMSAQLKTFFDRFTDLLTIKKELGKKLKGMPISVIATGTDEAMPLSFTQQFESISDYLGFQLGSQLYCCCPTAFELQQHKKAIQAYVNNIE
ncbi:NAD(P)H-dependent oxidoreductase [Alteromonas stellipolaris]|jgi:multimeric flavodoxin WrbA|uniref:flavodoxin family protein n=1 Tax=Alteromonas stellipolaris TaxID=233316 RepID=UPI00211845FA|nr:NAD(P)H-dependent oxidoreductase [Alteromonas stellipolaris]MCQ8848938.1 NAD(P)H-dependent oxidoreductase [Alteromonas stellipolaris]